MYLIYKLNSLNYQEFYIFTEFLSPNEFPRFPNWSKERVKKIMLKIIGLRWVEQTFFKIHKDIKDQPLKRNKQSLNFKINN